MTAVGSNNYAYGPKSTAVGSRNVALGSSSVSLGKSNFTSGVASQAVGDFNTSKAYKASAVGYKNVIDLEAGFSSAFGGYNHVTGSQSYAFGGFNIVNSRIASIFGFGNKLNVNSELSSVVGVQNVLTGSGSNIFGLKNKITGLSNLAIGSGNNIRGMYSIAIGSGAISNTISPLVGQPGQPDNTELEYNNTNTINGSYGIVIGYKNNLSADKTILIGNNIDSMGVKNSIVLGDLSSGAPAQEMRRQIELPFGELKPGLVIQNSRYGLSMLDNGSLSVGSRGRERQIKYVATGEISETSTDAINGSQLYAVVKSIGGVPLSFSGDTGSLSKTLGGIINIRGGAQGSFANNNIGVEINSDSINIKLSKNLTGLSSLKFDKGAILNGQGLVINSNLYFRSSGLLMGNIRLNPKTNRISGVEDPKYSKDVVNLQYLNRKLLKFPQSFELKGNDESLNFLPVGNRLVIAGLESNVNAQEFDKGKNVFTSIKAIKEGYKYTVAIKKSPEFENVTLTGTPAEGSTVAKPGKLAIQDGANKDKIIATVDGKGNSEIALKGASDKDIVKIGADSDSNGKVSVIGKDGANSIDLKHDGLAIKDASGTSNLGTNAQGTGGVEDLVANASAKKRRLTHTVDGKTEEIATLNDGLIVKGNTTDKAGVKLNNAVKVAGADSNTKWEDFDGGENIMTKVETKSSGETVIRVALRKDLKLKNGVFGGSGADGELKLKDKDGKDGLTLNSDKILFNNIEKLDENGRPQKNGSAGISMTQNGKPNLVEKGPATRIQITDGKGTPTAEVATMKDGLKFGSNSGDEASNLLNSKVNIIGQKSNNDWTKFDQGKNIMTNIEQKNGDTDITIALKRDVELDSATFGHGPAQTEENTSQEGKDGRIKLVNKNGKTTIQFDAGSTENQNSPAISISKSDSEDGTKLTSEGIEITKGPSDRATSKTTKAFVSIAPEGTARIEQDQSQTRPRLTLRSGEGESAITEEIATMNDGLRFKGDSEELINKPLSSTLSIVGGETDSTKLTSVDTDKNIGVIVKDVANSGSRAPKDKVMQVRLAKKLKGLQSAEFKPVDDKGNPTGQTITVDSDGVSVAKEGKKSQFNEEGLKVGEDGPSVTDKGISAGGLSIANVGNPMKPHHASTKGYVDTEVKHLKNKINERYKDALGASAMAMASSGLMPPSPGKSAFAVASAVVAGQPAFAMGLTTMTENGKLMFKGAVASDARGQVGGLVGAAYQW
ncbi:YadA-like family protein [Taylorella equigenitalis]|uniref:YadA-like family protein n=1 Tax=Taylorella equigenitalis TaxID=29575 RepID=UPI000BAC52C9|nr:YadA-like family protein [Taylorella equigenitalis]ASY38877.1 hemagglutinin [Taylorella equigenitalis]